LSSRFHIALRQPNSRSAKPSSGNSALATALGLGSVAEELVVPGVVLDEPVGVLGAVRVVPVVPVVDPGV
jgi:hypothetical protein